MMLSSLSDDELRNAIIAENVAIIKGIKGIGVKTAQRLILELKDKVVKGEGSSDIIINDSNNNLINEATSALVMLGFSKANINKVVHTIIKDNPQIRVEELIKDALQRL